MSTIQTLHPKREIQKTGKKKGASSRSLGLIFRQPDNSFFTLNVGLSSISLFHFIVEEPSRGGRCLQVNLDVQHTFSHSYLDKNRRHCRFTMSSTDTTTNHDTPRTKPPQTTSSPKRSPPSLHGHIGSPNHSLALKRGSGGDDYHHGHKSASPFAAAAAAPHSSLSAVYQHPVSTSRATYDGDAPQSPIDEPSPLPLHSSTETGSSSGPGPVLTSRGTVRLPPRSNSNSNNGSGSSRVARIISPLAHQVQNSGIEKVVCKSQRASTIRSVDSAAPTVGSCPGDGRCNGMGGKMGCEGCPTFNNRPVDAAIDETTTTTSTTRLVNGNDHGSEAVAGLVVAGNAHTRSGSLGIARSPVGGGGRYTDEEGEGTSFVLILL